jgi:hypothetical protein
MLAKIIFIQTRIRSLLSLLFFFAFFSETFSQIPSGYYSTIEGKSGADLKTTLHQIICNDTTGYLFIGSGTGSVWQGFYNADRKVSNDSVLDMYSYIARYFPNPNPNYVSFGGDLQIEHSFPSSWWGGADNAANKDLHHLFPSDGNANSAKSNFPLGVVTGTVTFSDTHCKVGYANYSGYTDRVFEPRADFRGDFARAYFYTVTAFQNYSQLWNSPMLNNNTYPVFNTWALNVLLDWHRNDPVSQKENDRNNVVFGFQNNRNPFIDYPQLVEHIWGNASSTPFYFTLGAPQLAAYKEILSSNSSLSFHSFNSVPEVKVINIRGTQLMSGISISLTGTNAALFSASVTTVSVNDAENGVNVTITYSPTIAGAHSATLTLTSTNATPFVINLSGVSQ